MFTNAWEPNKVVDLQPNFKETKFTEEGLMRKKVIELQEILRSNGLLVSGHKADLVQRILSHVGTVKVNVLGDYAAAISETQFAGKSPPSQSYSKIFNGTDLYDKLQRDTSFQYRAAAWEIQLVLGICEFSIMNSWVLYCEMFPEKSVPQSDNFIIFRKSVTDSLMNLEYKKRMSGRKIRK